MLNAVKQLYCTVGMPFNGAIGMLHCVQHDGRISFLNNL
jgi:hypothetical protein